MSPSTYAAARRSAALRYTDGSAKPQIDEFCAIIFFAPLLRLHPRDLDHVRPLLDVGAQKLVELGGAHLER